MKQRAVHSLEVVEGFDFFGYHPQPDSFLKINVFDPDDAASLGRRLQSGRFCHTLFSVYDSHLPYILQFQSTFGIKGNSVVELNVQDEPMASALGRYNSFLDPTILLNESQPHVLPFCYPTSACLSNCTFMFKISSNPSIGVALVKIPVISLGFSELPCPVSCLAATVPDYRLGT